MLELGLVILAGHPECGQTGIVRVRRNDPRGCSLLVIAILFHLFLRNIVVVSFDFELVEIINAVDEATLIERTDFFN